MLRSLPAIKLFGVLPVGMQLSHVFLLDNIMKFLCDLVTIFVMIDTLSTITFDDVFAKEANSFVSDLSLAGSLLRGQQEFDGILSSSNLQE